MHRPFFHCSFILNDSHSLYQLEFLIVIYRNCLAILSQKENMGLTELRGDWKARVRTLADTKGVLEVSSRHS